MRKNPKTRAAAASSVLDNYEMLTEAYFDSVENSANSAQKELNTYLDSIDGKLQQLQNHLQELAATTIDSQWLKDLIDLGTIAVELVTFLVDKFGGLNTILGTIGGILTQKKGLGLLTGKNGKFASGLIGGIINSFNSTGSKKELKVAVSRWVKDNGVDLNFGDLLKVHSLDNSTALFKDRLASESLGINAGLQEYINKLGEAKAATMSLQQIQDGYFQSMSFGQRAIAGLKNVMSGLLSTVLTVGAEMLIFAALGAAFNKIMDAVHAHENRIKAGQEAQQLALKTRDEISNVSSIDKAGERYTELRSGVYMNGNTIKNLSLSAEEYQEFLDINQKLVDTFPFLRTGAMDSGQALADLGNNAEKSAKKMNDLVDAQNRIYANSLKESIPRIITGIVEENMDIDKDIAKQNEIIDLYEELINKASQPITVGRERKENIFNFKGMEDAEKSFLSILDSMNVEYGKYNDVVGIDVFDSNKEAVEKAYKSFLDDLRSRIQQSFSTISADEMTKTNKWLSGFVPNFLGVLQQDPTFISLPEELSNNITEMFNSVDFDYDSLFNQFGKDAEHFDEDLKDRIIIPIKNALEEGKISEVELNDIFDFNFSTATNEEMRNQINDTLNKIFPGGEGTENYKIKQQILVGLDYKYVDDLGETHWNATDTLASIFAGLGGKVYKGNNGKNVYEKGNSTVDWEDVKTLDLEEQKILSDSMSNNNFNFVGEGIEALREYIKTLRDANKALEDAPTGTLKELLENESFKESASTYETNISTLQTALDNFREAGELTSEQMKDLFGSFENLAKYGDDLTMENIGDEMLKNFNDFYDLFKTTMEDVNLTPEAKIAAQNYIDAFFDQLATVPVSALTGENALKDMIVTATGMDAESLGKRSEQVEQYNDIIEALRSKYDENIDWGVVLSVLVNTDPAELETDQFIQDVETQKATIKIEADLTAAKQELDKFVEKTESGISAQEAKISAKQAKASSAEFAQSAYDASIRGIDTSRTVFGNIDTANRQPITWDRNTLRQNRDTLEKWDLYDPANMLGTTSTILGGSESFYDLEIAFSPMLQTDNGAELLTPSTVNKYINSLIKNVMSDHPGEWYTEDLLAKSEDLFALDVEGLEIDGKHIQNLLADIGETAIETGEKMHYVGAVSLAANEFMPTEADYAPIIEGREAIAKQQKEYYEKVLAGYNYAKKHGASETSLDNILTQLNQAETDLQTANTNLLNAQKESRESTLDYYNVLLNQHKGIGESLEGEKQLIENNGGVISKELAAQIAGNRRSQIAAQETIIRENQRLYDDTGDISYLQNVTSARTAADEIRQSGTTARDIMADSRIASLQVAMTELENKANEVQDAITLQEGEGLKPTLKQYNNLINNGEKQIGNLAKQNELLRIQLRSLVNNGKVLEANKGRWRTIRNQIAANNSAIAKMNANLKNWQMSLKSMGGDLGNSMLSALQAAFDEAISPTGLQYNTMKELAAQFEGVEGFDFADIFYNTANGVKLDADATQRVVDAKYGLVTDDIKKRIEEQTESLNGLKEQYNATTKSAEELNIIAAQIDIKQEGLDNLYNQLAQYQAFYGEAQKLFTGYGDWSRALQTANAGDTYNEIRDYLKTQEENFEQGLIGTDDFKTFTAMYDEWGRNTQAAYIKNREQMKLYLTEDATGMANFFNDLVATGYAQKTGEASWHLNDIRDTGQAAHAMGMSEEFLTYMLGKSEDYGFHIDYVKDQIDGELKIQEAIHETADLIERRNELIAQGAPLEAIDEANAQINELDERIINLRENTQDVTARAGKVTAQEIKAAVDTIDLLKERYDNAVSDQERNVLRQEIENAAEEFGIVIKPDLTYEMPEQYAGYEQALVAPDYKKAAEVTADEIKAITTMYGGDGNLAAWAPDYQSAINKIGESWEANKEEAQKYLDVLKFADVGALKTIDLDDGQTIAGMEREEEALDGLKTLFGLTSEEAKNLVAVLDQVGLVGALAGTEAAEGLQTLFDVAGQGGTLDVDMSLLETYINEHKDDFDQMSTIDLRFDTSKLNDQDLEAKLGLINEMKAEVDVETEGGEEAMQTLNEVEEICKDEQNFRTKVDFILNESGLTKDEFLELTTEEQAGITHKVGIEPETEDFDRFLEYVQNNTIEQRIQAVLDSDSSKTLEDWIKLGEDEDKREEFKLYFGIETDEEYDTTMAELKKREAEGFDTKVALNSTSIEGIGEAIGKELSNIDINVNKENVDKGNSALQTMINKIDEINKKRINLKTNDSAIGVKPISQTDDGGVKRSVTSSVQQAKSIAGSGVNVPIKTNTSSLKAIKSGIDNVRNSTNTPINLRVNSETVRAALLNVLKQIDTVRKNAELGITLGVKTGDSITKVEELQTAIEAAKNTLLSGIAVRAEVKGKDKVDELKEAIDLLYGKTVSIHEYGAEESTKRVNDLKAAIDALYGKTVYVAEFGAADSYNRVFDLREEIDRLQDKTVTVTTRNVTINETRDIHTDGGGLTATATGTLTSIGMAYAKGTIGEDGKVTKSGSAYNVYNYKDAKVAGDVGVNKDLDALINELGTESLMKFFVKIYGDIYKKICLIAGKS